MKLNYIRASFKSIKEKASGKDIYQVKKLVAQIQALIKEIADFQEKATVKEKKELVIIRNQLLAMLGK